MPLRSWICQPATQRYSRKSHRRGGLENCIDEGLRRSQQRLHEIPDNAGGSKPVVKQTQKNRVRAKPDCAVWPHPVRRWHPALRLADSSQQDSQYRLTPCAGTHLELRFHTVPRIPYVGFPRVQLQAEAPHDLGRRFGRSSTARLHRCGIPGGNKPSHQQTDFLRPRSLSRLGFRLFQLRTKDFGIDDCWWEECFSVAILIGLESSLVGKTRISAGIRAPPLWIHVA